MNIKLLAAALSLIGIMLSSCGNNDNRGQMDKAYEQTPDIMETDTTTDTLDKEVTF